MTNRASTPSQSPAPRLTRRAAVGGLAVGLAGVAAARFVQAQEGTPEGTPDSTPVIEHTGTGDMPTQGGLRPGPVGEQPPEAASTATIPVAISVPAATIDAEVEVLNIVNGKLEDPTGPWVVSWYQQSAGLGEAGNVLMAGHVDYWGVGPSVFYNVKDLVAGDEIEITGENGVVYAYAVTTNETYSMDDLVSGTMAELAAPTEIATVTIFTCGGEFDYVNGEYLSRTVVRGERIPNEPTSSPEA